MNDEELKIGTKLYYARIMPTLGVFDIYDMKVVALYDTYFAAQEKRDKRRFLFYYTDIQKQTRSVRTSTRKRIRE